MIGNVTKSNQNEYSSTPLKIQALHIIGDCYAIGTFRFSDIFCIINPMRKLNVAVRNDTDPVLQGLCDQAMQNSVSDDEESRLIEQVRTGNIFAIESLILSCEHIIFKLMIQCEVDPPYDKSLEYANAALRNLAKMEVGRTSRPVFSRLSTWVIRQALLEKKGNIR